MRISFLAVGNELLDGLVMENNSVFLALELKKAGLNLVRIICIRDNREEIVDSLRYLGLISDAVIITGGIGPTEDDKTRAGVAMFLGRNMALDENLLLDIRKFFQHMNIVMPDENKNQALVIDGSIIIPNPHGTAPGFIIPGETVIAAFPGVPSEFKSMFPFFMDYLQKNRSFKKEFESLYYKTIGVPESFLGQALKSLQEKGISVGTIAHFGQIDLRFDVPVKILEKSRAEIEKVLSANPFIKKKVFSTDPEEDIVRVVLRKLTEENKTLMLAESCTGGLVSKLLTDIPGSSKVLLGSMVTYDNRVKSNVLNIPDSLIKAEGAVSFETARFMILGLNKITKSSYSISITGIAGPDGGSKEKPVGTVFIGFGKEKNLSVYRFQFSGSRDIVRMRTVMRVFEILWEDLLYGKPEHQTWTGLIDFKEYRER